MATQPRLRFPNKAAAKGAARNLDLAAAVFAVGCTVGFHPGCVATASALAGSAILKRWGADPPRDDWWKTDIGRNRGDAFNYVESAEPLAAWPAASAIALAEFERFLGASNAANSEENERVVAAALQMQAYHADASAHWLESCSRTFQRYMDALASARESTEYYFGDSTYPQPRWSSEGFGSASVVRVREAWGELFWNSPRAVRSVLPRFRATSIDRVLAPIVAARHLEGTVGYSVVAAYMRASESIVDSDMIDAVSGAFSTLADKLRGLGVERLAADPPAGT